MIDASVPYIVSERTYVCAGANVVMLQDGKVVYRYLTPGLYQAGDTIPLIELDPLNPLPIAESPGPTWRDLA